MGLTAFPRDVQVMEGAPPFVEKVAPKVTAANGPACGETVATASATSGPARVERSRSRDRPTESKDCPTGDEPIKFDQRNPKGFGSDAYNRYERYKRARTVEEALALGAKKGDIKHDFKKGFCSRISNA